MKASASAAASPHADEVKKAWLDLSLTCAKIQQEQRKQRAEIEAIQAELLRTIGAVKTIDPAAWERAAAENTAGASASADLEY